MGRRQRRRREPAYCRVLRSSRGHAVGPCDHGLLYKYTARTLIKAFVNTASTTPATGTLKVVLKGIVDEEFDTTPLVAS